MVHRIGERRHAVTIEQPTASNPDAYSERTTSWSNYATGVWAGIDSQGSREVERAQQTREEVTHVVKIEYDSGVTVDMRIKFGSRYLDIAGVQNTDERDRELVLACVEQE